MTSKGNIFLPLISAFAIVAVVATGYFFWQNQNYLNTIDPAPRSVSPKPSNPRFNLKITNWKTYAASDFELQYPPDWTISSGPDTKIIRLSYPSFSPQITVGVVDGELEDNLNQIKNQIKSSQDAKLISETEIIISKAEWNQIRADLPMDGANESVYNFTSQNGKTYQFIWTTGGDISEETFEKVFSTFKFFDQNIVKTVPPVSKINIEKISYALPQDWTIFQDSTSTLEVGYDPAVTDAQSEAPNVEVRITGKWQNNPVKKLGGDFAAYIGSYDGGSRHANLYNAIGLSSEMLKANQWKHPSYQEKEYSYNGWSCLVIIGVDISQYPQIWGICPISSSNAVYFTGGGLEDSPIKQFIKTIKVLK